MKLRSVRAGGLRLLKLVLKRAAGLVLFENLLHIGQMALRAKENGAVSKEAQLLLALEYRQLARRGETLPRFADVGFRAYSQTDEDGILLYIFSLIGTTNRRVVEICAGNGLECNSANLIINHGWQGLLFDGKIENVLNGRAFYARCQDTFLCPPTLAHAWIDAKSVNRLIEAEGFAGEIDLLSLDLDGVDYWIWKSLECIKPRVVVLEYQGLMDPLAVTVPYREDFDRHDIHMEYYGASLHAFVALARAKGYRLVGCNRHQFNAFFVRNGIGEELLPEVEPASCLDHPRLVKGRQRLHALLAQYKWVQV